MPDEYFTGTNGYRVHRSDPNRYEHRDVWSAAHGVIPSGFHIHHKNKIRTDNRIENLECLEARAHLRLHGLIFLGTGRHKFTARNIARASLVVEGPH